jgi:hypothetical protein
MIDLAPLLYIGRAMEWPLLLLLRRLLLTISVIPTIHYIDLPIVLLLLPWWPIVTRFKEPGSSLRCLNAHINNYK